MAVTRLDVRRALVECGLEATRAEIDDAMAKVDQGQMVADERAKYTIEVWDKQSPINGADPAKVIESHSISEHGTAYMIREGGRIVYFQARSPFDGSVITSETAQTVADQHLDAFAAARAAETIIEAIIDQLDV